MYIVPIIKSTINKIIILTCMILKIEYFRLAMSFEIVDGIPSCEMFKSNINVGKVSEYIDIAIVEIFLAIMIFAKIESVFANVATINRFKMDLNEFFLMIFHLSYCLFYEKMVKYMSKYFFNIYIYILLCNT